MCVRVCVFVYMLVLLNGCNKVCSGTHCVLPVNVSWQPLPRTEAPQVVSHMRRFFHVWGWATHGVFLGHGGQPLKSCFMSLAQTACAGSCTDLMPSCDKYPTWTVQPVLLKDLTMAYIMLICWCFELHWCVRASKHTSACGQYSNIRIL